MASPTINTYTSFSGADLIATFANKVIGELQQISWAVQRDKAPVFTCGSPDARSFSRGKRGIAGSMVFAVFDHDSLVDALQSVWDQIAPAAMFTAAGNIGSNRYSEDFQNALDMSKWNQVATDTAKDMTGYGFSFGVDSTGHNYTKQIAARQMTGSNNTPPAPDDYGYIDQVNGWKDSNITINVPVGFSPIRGNNVVYADTLPPFDVTLTFASEYGNTAFQKIYDVDILNESSGASTDTVVMSRQVTWIARRLSPLIKGVYTRETNGQMNPQHVVAAT